MSKATPGPWPLGEMEQTVIIPGICGEIYPMGNTYEETLANARLIAAAPEMLEALRGLAADATGFVSMADPHTHGKTNIQVLKHWIEKANSAIEKAEGK